MIAAIGSILSGGLTGVLGSLATNVLNYFFQSQKNDQEYKLKELDLKRDALDHRYRMEEVEANIRVEQIRTEGAIELKESEGWAEAQRGAMAPLLPATFLDRIFAVQGRKAWLAYPVGCLIGVAFTVVDFVKHLMRPGLTIVMMYVFYEVIVVQAWGTVRSLGYTTVFTPAEAMKLLLLGVDAAIYLTVTVVSWWFSDRRTAKFLMRLSDGNMKK